MRRFDFSAISALPLLRGAAAATIDLLLRSAEFHRFQKQQIIVKEGDKPEFLYILTEGTVELVANHNEQETTIDLLKACAPLALVAVLTDAMILCSARTIVPSTMLLFPAQAVRAACARDGNFAQAALDEIAYRYEGSIRALKNIKLRTSVERLANWILQAVNDQGDGQGFALEYDKGKIASHLGMTPENFSRNLARLTKYGVRSSGRDIFIDDPIALSQFAKPSALLDG